ncbi:MAG: PSD1 domain-containing protein [Planctomycetes bacterium]|nr:PSD1 domain-containing protein [Planctomycetota bacterium]
MGTTVVFRSCVAFTCASFLAALPSLDAGEKTVARVEFNRDIRPILSDKCFFCHGPDAAHRKAKLRLDTEEGARVIVGGKPAESELYGRITQVEGSKRMPPPKSGKTLAKNEIELIRRWIEQGGTFQPHWSFAPPKRPQVPVSRHPWPRNPVDEFVLAKLQALKLTPAPEAAKVTLIRRVYFDLLGLPPSPAQVKAFLKDTRADAYDRLVDALLTSPHFGERMAMYWLDLVRYADTVGYHGDQEHHISPYRDYVIKAFNDNLPFDRFTIEQLAGDLLPNPTTDQLIATGYNRVLQTTHEGGAQDKEYLAIYSADRVRNLGAVWMGATIGCAQCHNHRYDPYTQKDFYRLAAFFADIDERGAFKGPDQTPTKRPPEIAVLSPIDRAEAEAVRQQIAALKLKPNRGDDLAGREKLLAEIEKRKSLTMITKSVKPRVIRVLHRGDWMDTKSEIVDPGAPHFMKPIGAKGRATRLDLARWLTSAEHPQTARVFVNRLWYLYFGKGLSKTLDDGGSQGDWPTHPELLDWLAAEFTRPSLSRGRGAAGAGEIPAWNVKHLVKLLVTSATYRQSSLESDAHRKLDPGNRFFSRQSRYRLPAEMIRDQALAVSGLLADRLGGRSVKPAQPDGYYAHLNFPRRTYVADKGLDQYRRGVYTHWQRTYLHPMLRAFDAPTREECTAQRPISNTPLAALVLLNDPSFVECARVLAARIIKEGGKSDAERIAWAWRQALSRAPHEREVAALARLYQANRKQYADDRAAALKLTSIGAAPRPADLDVAELAAWTSVARVLFNLDETITRN